MPSKLTGLLQANLLAKKTIIKLTPELVGLLDIALSYGHLQAEILALWKVSQKTLSAWGSKGTFLSGLAKGELKGVSITAYESLDWEKSKWVLTDPQQLKPDNCKLRIKCLFGECLINCMG